MVEKLNDLKSINNRIEKLKIQKNILKANSEQNINRKNGQDY